MKVYKSNRLHYRPFQNSDIRFLVALLSDDRVCRYLPGNIGYPESKIHNVLYRFVNSGQSDPYYQVFLVSEKDTMKPIGYAGIQIVKEYEKYEIFYAYIPESWGKGYATEASLKMKEIAKNSGLKELIALADVENIASQTVLEHTGYINQGEIHLWGLDLYYYEMNI